MTHIVGIWTSCCGYRWDGNGNLELLLKRPLQWSICLLHLNELPLRHIFMELNSSTNGPGIFSGPIRKLLNTNVSHWHIIFKINLDANEFYNMINVYDEINEPPVLKRFSDDGMKQFEFSPLMLWHPCHNQTVKQHVKMVSEASRKVATFQRRDARELYRGNWWKNIVKMWINFSCNFSFITCYLQTTAKSCSKLKLWVSKTLRCTFKTATVFFTIPIT